MAMDRISQLPDPILHQILHHLSPKQAIRTSALSKSWRYVGSTRPTLELRESFFKSSYRKSIYTVLDNTLQRCSDQNLHMQDFLLDISNHMNSDMFSLLEKCIHTVVVNLRVKTFSLTFDLNCFFLPPIVLLAESLQELHLKNCRLSLIKDTHAIRLNRLRKLSLTGVYVSDKTLERIISNCPLIEHVTISTCYDLEAIRVNKVPNLKHFVYVDGSDDGLSIQINAPSIECVSITGHDDNWIHTRGNHLSFTGLKSLYLSDVRLSQNSFHRFSVDFCCLEDLAISDCHGFKQFKLMSRSIKNLSLKMKESQSKADIDVPNILCFEFSCIVFPSISFTTTSSEWNSKISILSAEQRHSCRASSMLLKVYEFHKAALSHSKFSLHIEDPSVFLLEKAAANLYPPPVVIENLSVLKQYSSLYSLGAFLSVLFCSFRPRHIIAWCRSNPEIKFESDAKYLNPWILEDLEEVQIESSKENGEESECGLSDNQMKEIHFRLKWRVSC